MPKSLLAKQKKAIFLEKNGGTQIGGALFLAKSGGTQIGGALFSGERLGYADKRGAFS